MSSKRIDKETYLWSHIGVIIYHVLTGVFIFWITYKNFPKDIQIKLFGLKLNARKTLLVISGLLILISLLSIGAFAKDYDTITIN